MKVLVNAVSAKSGGAATYISNLCSEIPKLVNGYRFVFCVPSNYRGNVPLDGACIEFLSSDVGFQSAWQRFLWDQISLRRIMRREKINLLLSSSDFGMLFPPGKQILMIRNPLFFSDVYLEKILPRKSLRYRAEFLLRRKLIALSASFSDAVMTASESMMSDVRKYISIPDDKAFVNPFGVPLDKFDRRALGGRDNRRGRGTRNEPLRLLYVSEYSDYKNLTTLLRAVILFREQGIGGIHLTSTADPEQFPSTEVLSRKIDRLLATRALAQSSITFTGSIPYESIEKLYRDSGVFVFPSLAESFGHPLVEAMASGLPVIASDIPICREICGNAALYFSPLDPMDLVNKILVMKNYPELRLGLGEAGVKRARSKFNWRDHVSRLVEIIRVVSGQP